MSDKKVLVVDDEEVIREILEIAFTRRGYTVRLAENAEGALDILRGERIQVMFLDLIMPGMNGFDLCRKIRKKYPESVIHALTGRSSHFEPSDFSRAGFDGCFKKPMQLEDIHKAAEEAFKKINTGNTAEAE